MKEWIGPILRHRGGDDRSSAESGLSSAAGWQAAFGHDLMQCVEKELNGMNRNLVTPGRRSRQQGFSLIELMVTTVVAAVLLAVAIPSFRNLILSNELTTTTNEWVTAVNVARSEAIKRSAGVVICGAGGNESGASDLSNGCAGNLGQVRAFQAGTTTMTVVRAAPEIPNSVSLANTQSLRFGSTGIGRLPNAAAPYTGLGADISSPDLGGENHRCVRVISGTTVTTEPDTVCN